MLHLLHDTSVGGVEAAAEHLREQLAARPGVRYRIAALADSPAPARAVRAEITGRGVNSPLAALLLLAEVRRSRPDVLVTSLWRVVALGPIARRLSPTTRWVPWVHLPRYTNPLDRLVHERLLPRADAILCDSAASREAIVRPALARAGITRPMLLVTPEAAPLAADPAPRALPAADQPLRLVCWGRLAAQKRVDRVLRLAALLEMARPGGIRLVLAGPDDGEQAALERLAQELGIAERVEWAGPLDRARIAQQARSAHVFVQLSETEGHAMAAHEALGAGLLCVLTPVGDLALDTRDGIDALHHHGDLEETARRVLAVTEDASPAGAYARICARARESATGAAGSGEDMASAFLAACHRILAGSDGAGDDVAGAPARSDGARADASAGCPAGGR